MGNVYEVLAEVKKIIKGKDEVIKKVMAAILAGGHVLMEDIPGVGKTTLSTTFAKALSMDYKRVQFTPDVLPSDIVGFSMYKADLGKFEFIQGPIFCNFFLADEINRTSPKTQSALLEVMEEGSVTVDGNTYKMDDSFVVIATQNPSGSSGTNMLPDSQLDRFLIKVTMGYPDHNNTVEILKGNISAKNTAVSSKMDLEDLRKAKDMVENVFVHDSIYDYITSLCEASRNNEYINMGVSPRGAIALLKMSKAYAFLEGNDFVRASDIQAVIVDVFCHRIKISGKARSEGMNEAKVIEALLKTVQPPRQ